ncbi:MAG TPA: cytochrome c, partial [Archangium sp.]|uniref:c-type cytochrome n=1 Tax=Archangium sp. TaxID=1872627 RepID=UPI002ED9591A
MGKSLNSLVPLACTVSLAMALVLPGCSEGSNQKAPSSSAAATVFKDSPPQAAPADSAGASATPASPTPARPTRTPDQLFFNLGCRACHGPGSAYASSLVNARARPVEEIARYILHPEQVRPGTMMPSFAHRMTQEEALSLARWIK